MKPQIVLTDIEGLKIINPVKFEDKRGGLFETFHQKDYAELGIQMVIAQTYQSRSVRGVLRGLHYQGSPAPVAKIVRCNRGRVFDVAVDLRIDSPTFGRWASVELDDKDNLQFYIPEGFAHGFVALSEVAEVHYHQSDVYTPQAEGCIIWNDPTIAIAWPITTPIVADKDLQGMTLEEYRKRPAF